MKLTSIISCYNEEEALPFFYQEIEKVAEIMPYAEFELLFVDDGSVDRTLEILKNLAEKDERVKYISFSRNFGKEAAMYAGLENASRRFSGHNGCRFAGPTVFSPGNVPCNYTGGI